MTLKERDDGDYDWQDGGPILRNLPEGTVHSHFWSLLEAIVWVATRDEGAVAGAAGYLRDSKVVGNKIDLGPSSQLILNTYLPLDVASHHLDCPAAWENKKCTCEALGHVRYCRCPVARQKDAQWVCPCSTNAIRSVENAILDGFVVSGKPESANGWRKIDVDELAGARHWFDETGLRFVPGFTDLRLRIGAVKERWPEGFAEQPALPAEKSPQQVELDRLNGVALLGRPPLYFIGLKMFCDRVDAGLTLPGRSAEAKVIEKLFSMAKDGDVPGWRTVYGWIGNHYGLIDWQSSDPDRLAPAAASALADMKEKIDARLAVRKP